MRKVDKLGRIVIPQELRKKYRLSEGADVEFLDTGAGITVRPSESACKICGRVIEESSSLPLCDKCLETAAREYKERS